MHVKHMLMCHKLNVSRKQKKGLCKFNSVLGHRYRSWELSSSDQHLMNSKCHFSSYSWSVCA